jgi:hypothetical protein
MSTTSSITTDESVPLEFSQQVPIVITILLIIAAIFVYATKQKITIKPILFLILLSSIISIIINAVVAKNTNNFLIIFDIVVIIGAIAVLYIQFFKKPTASNGVEPMTEANAGKNKYYNYNW